MEKYPDVAVIYGDQHLIDARGRVIRKHRGPEPYRFEKIFCVEKVIPTQAAFIRRSYFKQVGFYADVTRPTCPDYEMWVRIGLKFQMKYVPGFVCRYRRHSGQEGNQPLMVVKMIESKREVIDRTIKDPHTSIKIKKLERRAHGGSIFWGAIVLFGNRAYDQCLIYLMKSFLICPVHLIKQLLIRMVTFPCRFLLVLTEFILQWLSLARRERTGGKLLRSGA